MRKVLGKAFFAREPDIVARELLGKFLVRRTGRKERAAMLVETEAYFGEEDGASHARYGPTRRNAPMYGPPGHWYVYLVYGMHWLLNVTTKKEGEPSAILLRAAEGLRGPGILSKSLGIGKSLNAKPAARASGLWIEDRGVRVPSRAVERLPRVGVGYAGAWAARPLRFRLKAGSV